MGIIKRFLVISIIFTIAVYALTLVYIKVQPKILEQREIKEKTAVLEIFEIPYEIADAKLLDIIPFGKKPVTESVQKQFSENIVVQQRWNRNVFTYFENDFPKGHAFTEVRKGCGFNKSAPWSIMIGIKPDLNTLIGIKPLDHGETPGLGGRINDKWFQNQFNGKKLKPEITWTKNKEEADNDENKFFAITGATNTTKGVAEFLNTLAKELWQAIDNENECRVYETLHKTEEVVK